MSHIIRQTFPRDPPESTCVSTSDNDCRGNNGKWYTVVFEISAIILINAVVLVILVLLLWFLAGLLTKVIDWFRSAWTLVGQRRQRGRNEVERMRGGGEETGIQLRRVRSERDGAAAGPGVPCQANLRNISDALGGSVHDAEDRGNDDGFMPASEGAARGVVAGGNQKTD